MNDYEARREARIARLRERAERKEAEAARRLGAERAILNVIPLGQPILVGHHSERRHRRDLARAERHLRAGLDASKEAEDLRRRADAAEQSTSVSTDDPDAVDKLHAKLAKLERDRATYREINTTIRTAKRHAARGGVPWEPMAVAALVDMGIGKGAAEDLVLPDFAGRIGVPDYRLRNLGSEIRRLKQRIAQIEAARAAPPAADEVIGDVRIETADNRTRLYFPGKPPPAIRFELKRAGFRWSPLAGAWQRHASDGALYHARRVAGLYSQPEANHEVAEDRTHG